MDWPSTLVAYHRTIDLTDTTAPADVLRGVLAEGQWALVRVREGELGFIDHSEAREGVIDPSVPGFLEPGVEFQLVPHGEVTFYVEYYRDASIPNEEE